MIKSGDLVKGSENELSFCLHVKCKNALSSSKNGHHILKNLEMISKTCLECKDAPLCNVFEQSQDENFDSSLQQRIQENLDFFRAAIVDHNGFNEDEIEALENQIQEALSKGEIALHLPKKKEN